MAGQRKDGRLRPRVAEFFAGRHVLVTGSTGFMGKVLVEKLLRSCPGVGTIYLLMRPKKGKDVQERVRELLESPVRPSATARRARILRKDLDDPHAIKK